MTGQLASLVVQVSSVQRLVHIAHKMDNVLQRLKPLFRGRVILKDLRLAINGADYAFLVGAISLSVVDTAVSWEVHIVLGCGGLVSGFICPGGVLSADRRNLSTSQNRVSENVLGYVPA